MTTQLEQIQTLEHHIDQLTLRLANLQAENRHLRRKVKENSQQGRILRQAHRDALIMLSWHYAGMSPSRQFCLENDISRRQWAWARSLLMCARIHDGTTIIEEIQPDAAMRLLKATVNRMEIEGIDRLRMRNFSYHKRSHSLTQR